MPRKTKSKRKLIFESDSDMEKESIEDIPEKKPNHRNNRKKKDSGEEEEAVEGAAGDNEDDGGIESAKKIRKIISHSKLSEDTRTAEAVEKARRKRIAERQCDYNEIIVEEASANGLVCPVTTRLVLDKIPGDEERVIEVSPNVIRHLKPHQVEAVKFLWECVIESLERHRGEIDDQKSPKNGNGVVDSDVDVLDPSQAEISKNANTNGSSKSSTSKSPTPSCGQGGGAILAHCMGLGKTLSVITFVHTVLMHRDVLNLHSSMVVCPVNTVLNWVKEFRQWIPANEALDVFQLASCKDVKSRLNLLRRWSDKGGVLVIGYDMFRNLASCQRIRRKQDKELIKRALINPGPGMVVCDEGHLLKNECGQLSQAMRQIQTLRRIVLTGTPLQNNLNEYHTMVDFVKPQLLGTKKEFRNRFVNPIMNGQHSCSTQRDVHLMKMRSHILFKTLEGCVQRKDYSALTKYLPPKLEYLVLIRVTEVQRRLYSKYLQLRFGLKSSDEELDEKEVNLASQINSSTASFQSLNGTSLFNDQQVLYRIWTHPFLLRMHESRESHKGLLRRFTESAESSQEESSSAHYSSFLESEQEVSDDNRSTSSSPSDKCDDDDDDQENDDNPPSKSRRPSKPAAAVPPPSTLFSNHSKRRKSRRLNKLEEKPKNCSTTTQPSKIPGSDEEVDEEKEWNPSRSSTKPANSSSYPSNPDSCGLFQPAWWHPLYKEEYEYQPELSNKLLILFHILRKCADIGDKVLLFTQSLFSLDIIEKYLYLLHLHLNPDERCQDDEDRRQLAASQLDWTSLSSDIGPNTWIRGLDYVRMDGATGLQCRNDIQDEFNDPTNLRLRLFLISTRAGGLGINLVAANRVVVFDVSWNPSHDVQSLFRSYRFGQTKPVFVYRLSAQGTMEEKIYERQIIKQSLSRRVVDEQQIQRHFSAEDLHALYSFEPAEYDPEESMPPVPKDRLLADLICELRTHIKGYHDHDSLLENREDEQLTEQERQEAWRHFEEEKRRGYSIINNSILQGAVGQDDVIITGHSKAPIGGLSAAHTLLLQQQQLQQQQQQVQVQQLPPLGFLPPGMQLLEAQTIYNRIRSQVYDAFPNLRNDPIQMSILINQFYQQGILLYLQNLQNAVSSGDAAAASPSS